jgi:FkbM family methyltransferase
MSAKKRENLAILLFNSIGYGQTSIKKEVDFFLNSINFVKSKPFAVLDIGANIGNYSSELLNRNSEIKVYSFEPSIYAGHNFKKNLKKFIQSNRCIFYNFGVGEKNSDRFLFAPEKGSGAASLYNREGNKKVREKVKIKVFSEAISRIELPIVGMKIDTEGHEFSILLSAQKLLKSKNFQVVQFEFGEYNLENQQSFKQYFDYLHGLGFKLFRISIFGLNEIQEYKKSLEIHWNTNYLAVKKVVDDEN